MPRTYLYALGWASIFTLALFLRLHDLVERPIHADEATGARILAQSIEGNDYKFNPKHFHGPLLQWSTQPIASVFGQNNWHELNLYTLRLSPVIAGTLLILTPLFWVRRIGAIAALTASALLATSPLLVYYSRMYIHETWLALFGILACTGLYSLLTKPNLTKALLTGTCLGLMFATKETFAISILSAALASSIGFYSHSFDVKPSTYVKPLILLILSSICVSAYFYTESFRHPQGILDAIRTFFVYETTAGHEKPFTYYLKLLIWPKPSLGIWWSEGMVLILSIVAIIFTFKRNDAFKTLISFLTICTVGHLLTYSFISYKTPWLMVLPWSLACLLAGTAFTSWSTKSTISRIILILLLGSSLIYQTRQSFLAGNLFANDTRNPYTYVPTSKDAPKIQNWLSQLAAMPNAQSIEPIAVVGKEYWPLPWYLRNFETIGYWPTSVGELQNLSVIFAMPSQTKECSSLLAKTHTELPRGLRSNVSVTLYLRNDLWNQWIQSPSP